MEDPTESAPQRDSTGDQPPGHSIIARLRGMQFSDAAIVSALESLLGMTAAEAKATLEEYDRANS